MGNRYQNKVTPSRLKLYRRCARRFWYVYVGGLKEPSTPSLLLGSAVHLHAENFQIHGRMPSLVGLDGLQIPKGLQEEAPLIKRRSIPIAESLVQHLRRQPPENVEVWFGKKYRQAYFTGRADLVTKKGVQDIKTVSDVKWAHTEETALTDIQTLIYLWAFKRDHFRFLNVRTRKSSRVWTTDANIPRDLQLKALDHVYNTEIVGLLKVYKAADAGQVTPDIRDCHSFGRPCPFMGICSTAGGRDDFGSLELSEEEETLTAGWLDDMLEEDEDETETEKSKKGKKTEKSKKLQKLQKPKKPKKFQKPQKPQKLQKGDKAEKSKKGGKAKKKGREKPAEEVVSGHKDSEVLAGRGPADINGPGPEKSSASQEKRPEIAREAPRSKAESPSGFRYALYIDCTPLQGVPFTLLPAFLAPYLEEIERTAGDSEFEEGPNKHALMLPYKRGEARLMADLVQARSSLVGVCLVIRSREPFGQVAIAALSPAASVIVQGLA